MVATATAVAAALGLTAVIVVFHFLPGIQWKPRDDLTDAIMAHRRETLAEPDYPEPMSRAVGAGGGAVTIEGGDADSAAPDQEAADETPSPGDIPDEEAERFEVEYIKEGEVVEVPENQTLLEAGEDQGWDLPYACREGQCLSCGGHVQDGAAEDFVVHDNQQMLESPELEDGYVLTCCAYPTADLSLETGETP